VTIYSILIGVIASCLHCNINKITFVRCCAELVVHVPADPIMPKRMVWFLVLLSREYEGLTS